MANAVATKVNTNMKMENVFIQTEQNIQFTKNTRSLVSSKKFFLDTRNHVCKNQIKLDKMNPKVRFLVFFIQNVRENLCNSYILLQCIPVLHNVHKYHIHNVCSCHHYLFYRYNGSVFFNHYHSKNKILAR